MPSRSVTRPIERHSQDIESDRQPEDYEKDDLVCSAVSNCHDSAGYANQPDRYDDGKYPISEHQVGRRPGECSGSARPAGLGHCPGHYECNYTHQSYKKCPDYNLEKPPPPCLS